MPGVENSLICPHCDRASVPAWSRSGELGRSPTPRYQDGKWFARWCICPACTRFVLQLAGVSIHHPKDAPIGDGDFFLVYPSAETEKAPMDVPPPYSTDYEEAAAVLSLSPKASAALSRRLLQMLLVDKGGAKKRDLIEQIDEVKGTLPPYIVTTLDAIRHMGNFAAHPTRDKATGAIIDVEAGEAETTLEAVRELLTFYFTDPQASQKKLAAIQAKLSKAGKPPLKTS